MKYPKRSQYKHAKQKKYHVSNWAEYNEGQRRRGDLTVWFDEEAIANWKADKSGKPGGQRVYSDMAIETGLVVRMVYKLAYRRLHVRRVVSKNINELKTGAPGRFGLEASRRTLVEAQFEGKLRASRRPWRTWTTTC